MIVCAKGIVVDKIRTVSQKIASRPTSDGADVFLRRSVGIEELSELDPFLLLNVFGTENPDHYMVGFPNYPHRNLK